MAGLMSRLGQYAGRGAIAAMALAGTVMASGTGISGTVNFAGGGPIPEGELRVSPEPGAGVAAQKADGGTSIDSNGKATQAAFALPPEADGQAAGGPVRITATVRDAGGRLLARGSGTVMAGQPVVVTLYPVMY